MINGAESVNAIKPREILSVSGVSPVPLLTAGTEGEELVLGVELQPFASAVPTAVTPKVTMNLRREKLAMSPYIRSMSMN